MISIILASRVINNSDSNISRLINTTIETMEPGDNVEFLIKYDSDDSERPSDEWFRQSFPIPVRTFTWSRCEGRHSIHEFQQYLFTRANPHAELIYNTSDDFVHSRKGWVREALEVARQFKYCMITGCGYTRTVHSDTSIQCVLAGPAESFYNERYPNWEAMNDGEYLQCLQNRYLLLQLTCPMWSRPFLECAQNMGWQANSDSWLSLLESIFYDTYGQKLLKRIPAWYERMGRSTNDRFDPVSKYYNVMELGSEYGYVDMALVKLLRCQAKNLWLNIQHDGAKL